MADTGEVKGIEAGVGVGAEVKAEGGDFWTWINDKGIEVGIGVETDPDVPVVAVKKIGDELAKPKAKPKTMADVSASIAQQYVEAWAAGAQAKATAHAWNYGAKWANKPKVKSGFKVLRPYYTGKDQEKVFGAALVGLNPRPKWVANLLAADEKMDWVKEASLGWWWCDSPGVMQHKEWLLSTGGAGGTIPIIRARTLSSEQTDLSVNGYWISQLTAVRLLRMGAILKIMPKAAAAAPKTGAMAVAFAMLEETPMPEPEPEPDHMPNQFIMHMKTINQMRTALSEAIGMINGAKSNPSTPGWTRAKVASRLANLLDAYGEIVTDALLDAPKKKAKKQPKEVA